MSGSVTTPAAGFADRPYFLLVVAALGWSATAVAARLAVGHVSPMVIVTLRLTVVLVLLGLFAGRRLLAAGADLLPHWRYVLAMGALGYTLFSVLFYWAAHYTTAVNMGLIQGLQPALILAAAFLAHRTRFTLRQGIGVLVTVIGVAVVASRGSLEVVRNLAFSIGDLGVLGAASLYSGYTVALRSRPAVDPLLLFAGMTFAAFLASLPFLAAEAWRGLQVWPDAKGLGIVLFIGLVPSFLSQVTYMRGVALIGPSRAGVFLNLMPVMTVLLGFLILGETLAPYHAVALVLVLGGIYLAERKAGDA